VTEPVRIGILNDGVGARDGSDKGGVFLQLARDMQLAIDEVAQQGRLDRPVEFVHEYGLGLPAGTAHAVERAYEALAEQGVLLVVGPATGDNAIVATPLADRFETPTINWSASERARSDWMFHLQVGSHEDESILLARHLAERRIARAGVIFDRSPIGHRHLGFFEEECDLVGVQLSARVAVSPLPADALTEVEAVRASGADALLYLGLGWAGRDVARARSTLGWDVPVAMNAAGMRGSGDPDYARDIDGWVYPDMYADGNAVFARLRSGPGRDRIRPGGLAFGYDMGQLVAEAIARAHELTRPGIKDGLERIKVVPAAEGHDGTTLSFGRWDRGALKGRFLVLRRWHDGASIELEPAASTATTASIGA
jgi:branched-chain amino acid transport system substrate-binding protein